MNATPSPNAADSPPELKPHLIAEKEIKRLLYMLPRHKNNATAIQFIATQSGIGTTSIVRDFAVVSGCEMGINTLLVSMGDATVAIEEHLVRRYYLPRTLLTVPPPSAPGALSGVDWLQIRTVKNSSLTVATPAVGEQKHPADWVAQLAQWRPHFELILIEAPPLRKSYLGVALASYIDASIIVIGAEETKKSEAKDLIYRIEEVKGNILGAILNKRRSHIPNILYHLPL